MATYVNLNLMTNFEMLTEHFQDQYNITIDMSPLQFPNGSAEMIDYRSSKTVNNNDII